LVFFFLCGSLLADPAVYAAPGRGSALLEAYQEDAARLARLLAEWEKAQAALAAAEADA
jgi:hypothetical protein